MENTRGPCAKAPRTNVRAEGRGALPHSQLVGEDEEVDEELVDGLPHHVVQERDVGHVGHA